MPHPVVAAPTFLPLIIALAIRRAERRIRQDLLDAGAVSASAAVPLSTERSLRRKRLRRLIDAGAVREVEPGQYYLDEGEWTRYHHDRRRRALIAVSVVVALGGLAFAVATIVSWRSH